MACVRTSLSFEELPQSMERREHRPVLERPFVPLRLLPLPLQKHQNSAR
jgi:hypothetical protein